MIDKDTVRKIKDAADIVEVVSDYVHLVKRGSNYMGLCPFHNEKTPSFSVNRNQNFCYCFSCHKGGSPVNFVMEKEGISYHDALLQLADKYGIKVEERELTDAERAEQGEREAMLTVNEWAMRRMQDNLKSTEEGRDVGLQYLYQRGITQEAIEKFRLGYALDKGSSLYDEAVNAGYDPSVLEKTGLCGTSREGRHYDRFRGRVIFPILNSAGKVLAFGGRALKGEAAKYINSPESAIYKKSNELYGIFQAKGAIARMDKCFLVEGYMDVIGMWQSGIENVVASSGTALTDGQIALIHRFSQNVTLIYDGDLAGIKASMRGIDMLLSHNLNVKLLLLPDNDDPDSFARKHTPEEFRDYVDIHETDFIRFKAGVLLSDAKADPLKRAEAIRSVVHSVASISDLIKRTMYIQECSRMFDVSEKVLTLEVDKEKNAIIDAQKRRRERARYDDVSEKQPVSQTETKDKEGGAAYNEFPESVADANDSGNVTDAIAVLQPFERTIINYVVRYGMLPLTEVADIEGNLREFNVIEYVHYEITEEKIDFSRRLFREIFNLALSMRDDYSTALADYTAEVDKVYDQKLKERFDGIDVAGKSMQQIEKAEQQIRDSVDQERMAELLEFSRIWLARELASYEDDDIRREVNLLLTDKYRLSRYHERSGTLRPEWETLDVKVPRAMWEWKDAIIRLEIEKLREEVKATAESGDTEHLSGILVKLQQMMKLRADYARFLGERIILPIK